MVVFSCKNAIHSIQISDPESWGFSVSGCSSGRPEPAISFKKIAKQRLRIDMTSYLRDNRAYDWSRRMENLFSVVQITFVSSVSTCKVWSMRLETVATGKKKRSFYKAEICYFTPAS